MSVRGPVQLINSFPPPTGIWRYARLVKLALKERARLATIALGQLDFSRLDPRESTLSGRLPLPGSLRTALNYAIPWATMPGLTRAGRSVLRDGGIVHYLAEEIPPWIEGPRVVATVHGNPMATLETDRYYTFAARYRTAVRRNLRLYARRVHAVVQSEYVRRGLEEWGYDGPIEVVPPAVDPIFHVADDRAKLRARFGLPADRRLLLSVSTAERRKNLGVLPEVMDRLPSDCLLVRVGPPVRGARTIPVASDAEMAGLYAASDVLLFPTLEEGFGFPVTEAFASGLPVVSSTIPVVEEVAGGRALLADPNDPAALAAACREAFARRAELVAGGLERAAEFRLERFAERLGRLYDGLPS